MIVNYDSIFSLRQAWLTHGRSRYESDPEYYGYETQTQTKLWSQSGNTNLVPEAEKLLSQLETEVETPRKTWHPAVAGAYAVVPDMLAGRPQSMRQQTLAPDFRAPLTILASVTAWAATDSNLLIHRGTLILALTLALTRFRPTELIILGTTDGIEDGETIITAKINTQPLDLSTACYVLTSCGFSRRLMYDLARGLNGFKGGWPKTFDTQYPEKYLTNLIPRLGLDPQSTLALPIVHHKDPMLLDPSTWINTQVRRFANPENETET